AGRRDEAADRVAESWGAGPRPRTVAPSLRRSSQQARESPIRQDLAARLAGRAVRDLVVLVRDAPEVGAAAVAGLPRASVHRDVITELGGEAPAAAPFSLERVPEGPMDRRDECRPLIGI